MQDPGKWQGCRSVCFAERSGAGKPPAVLQHLPSQPLAHRSQPLAHRSQPAAHPSQPAAHPSQPLSPISLIGGPELLFDQASRWSACVGHQIA